MLTQSSSSNLLASQSIVPRSTSTALNGELNAVYDVGSATAGAEGYLESTTTSVGSLSPGLASVMKYGTSPIGGGLISVGFNYLNGDYSLYQPTQQDIIKNDIGVGFDFVTGALNSFVGGIGGTVVGGLAAGAAIETGPAAPVIGVGAGVITGGAISAGLTRLEQPLRANIVNLVYNGYELSSSLYQSAVDFTSSRIIPTVMTGYQSALNFTSSNIAAPILGQP